jgi:class 3 adenylate cyclase/tetratricopeptide (TPR) repeat protein
MVCPHCGTSNDAGAPACAACGSPLRTDSPAPERRYATVVFADLVGFTAFAEGRDPEDVHAVVDRCLSMLGTVVAEHGGFVTRVIGDEVMALFGAPVAHGDDAERAVRAALAMQRRMSADEDLADGFQLRVGINSGVVLYAPLGPDATGRPTVMGDAVNVAARLRSAAEPAGVLVGRESHRTTRHAIDYADAQMLTVRGKSAPLPAWTALRARTPSQTASPWTLPLIDRTAEMASLQDAWRDVCASAATRVVAMVGAAGIGKSRLVEAFSAQLDHEAARVLRGWALAYGTGTGYGPLSQQLRADAGVTDGQRVSEARTLLWARMQQVVEDADELDEANVAALAGLADGQPIAERQGLLAFARRYVEALARRRPTALVFEDMHWADPSVLDVIELVATRTRDVPLLVVVSARPELLDMRPGWDTDAVPIRIVRLTPLGEEDARELVSAAVTDGGTHADAAALAERAGGNPLFILELVAAHGSGATAPGDVPPTVQNLIAARLDALQQDCRQLALAAAVVGKAFSRDDVIALHAGHAVDEQLDRLTAAGVIQRAGTPADGYAFNHDLIRDVAYETLARSTRRRYHAQIARRLEAAHAGTVDELAGQVAYHWLRTDDPAAAVPYLVAAAERASHAWATQEAAALYSQALEVLPADDDRTPGLRLAHAVALTDAGDLARACVAFESLVDELSGAGRVEAFIQWSKATFWTMDTAGAQRLARRAKDEAETISTVLHARAAVHLCNALSSLETRTAEGIAEGEAIIRSWPADAPRRDRGAMLGMLAAYHYWVGDFGAAIDRGREGYQISRDLRSLDDMLLASSHLALGLTGAGRHIEALQVCRDAAADGLAHELIPRFTARLYNVWANALRELGDLDRARERNEEAIELGERAAFPPPIVQSRIDMLYTDLAAGEPGRAARRWPELQAQAAAMKAWHNWLTIGRLATARAEILLATSEPETAAEAAHAAIDHARRVGRRKYEVASRQVLGHALLAQRRPREAVDVFDVCLRDARLLGRPTAVMRAAAGLRDAAMAAGDDDWAEGADGVARTALRSFLDRVGDQWREHVLSTAPARAVTGA